MLWVRQQNKNLDIRLDGKKLNQRDSFVYLGGVVCRDSRRIQAGVNVWRKVEGVLGDKHISWTLKGKVLSSAYLYGLETMTEKQQEKLQVCKNNWVKRMEELREEVGMKESLTRKLVRSRLKWAGYMERMEGELLTKRADALRVERRSRR